MGVGFRMDKCKDESGGNEFEKDKRYIIGLKGIKVW